MTWWVWMIAGVVLLGTELLLIDAQFYLVFLGLSAMLVGLLGLVEKARERRTQLRTPLDAGAVCLRQHAPQPSFERCHASAGARLTAVTSNSGGSSSCFLTRHCSAARMTAARYCSGKPAGSSIASSTRRAILVSGSIVTR